MAGDALGLRLCIAAQTVSIGVSDQVHFVVNLEHWGTRRDAPGNFFFKLVVRLAGILEVNDGICPFDLCPCSGNAYALDFIRGFTQARSIYNVYRYTVQ